ncbi:MAG: energy-coupling factor transporter transmembrane protein EcfT, partial [Treponema sp.]|nr:energy-coupling factor transporter transmembrane protein EcfT [Treponema sp.]
FQSISQAQQARGLELTKRAHVMKRLKGSARLLLPLILSSLDRIDVISCAMELRSFGKYKKRSWYSSRPFTKADSAALFITALLFAAGIWFTFRDGDRFYNPFL